MTYETRSEEWRGVGVHLSMDKPEESGAVHYNGKLVIDGEPYYPHGIYNENNPDNVGSWFVMLPGGAAHGDTFAEGMDKALSNALHSGDLARRLEDDTNAG